MATITIYGHVSTVQATAIHTAVYTASKELSDIYIDDVIFTKYGSGATVTFESEELVTGLSIEDMEVLKNLIRDITNAITKLD